MTVTADTSVDRHVAAHDGIAGTWAVPTSPSHSREESFLPYPLAFRFSNVQKLPEAATEAATPAPIVVPELNL